MKLRHLDHPNRSDQAGNLHDAQQAEAAVGAACQAGPASQSHNDIQHRRERHEEIQSMPPPISRTKVCFATWEADPPSYFPYKKHGVDSL